MTRARRKSRKCVNRLITLKEWSQWQGSRATCSVVSDDAARVWLTSQGKAEALAKYFAAADAAAEI